MELPPQFEEYTRRLLGDTLYSRLDAGLRSDTAPVSIRLNAFAKCHGFTVSAETDDGPVPWCHDTGRWLKERPDFTFDPLFHAGLYYVQEAGSMFVCHVARHFISRPSMVLDLCAAPGGKSTALRGALPHGSLLFANEAVRQRAQVLSENMAKYGHEDVVVTNNMPEDYGKSGLLFDAIFADVPCSGEGMFRKDHDARAEWSVENVEKCHRLQRKIIEDVWDCLRPGGLLVYSTCTFNALEDEDNVAWIANELGADVLSLPVDEAWHITGAVSGSLPAYRFLPGVSRSEGLFLAVLRKHGGLDSEDTTAGTCNMNCTDTNGGGDDISWLSDNRNRPSDSRHKSRGDRRGGSGDRRNGSGDRRGGKGNRQDATAAVKVPLTDASAYTVARQGDAILAVPSRWADIYSRANEGLRVMRAGIHIYNVKGKDLVPDTSLALSMSFDRNAFAESELDYDRAVAFLRREAVTLPQDCPKGYVTVTYMGVPLGFVKNIGSRANNLYPQEWRIRSTHLPAKPEVLQKD